MKIRVIIENSNELEFGDPRIINLIDLIDYLNKLCLEGNTLHFEFSLNSFKSEGEINIEQIQTLIGYTDLNEMKDRFRKLSGLE